MRSYFNLIMLATFGVLLPLHAGRDRLPVQVSLGLEDGIARTARTFNVAASHDTTESNRATMETVALLLQEPNKYNGLRWRVKNALTYVLHAALEATEHFEGLGGSSTDIADQL